MQNQTTFRIFFNVERKIKSNVGNTETWVKGIYIEKEKCLVHDVTITQRHFQLKKEKLI